MVSKKVGNCDKWVDDKHTDYPPSFCFIGNPFIYNCINNHPYFKGGNQYSNDNNNWQPHIQVQYMVSIHACIVIAARAAGPGPSSGRRAGERLAAVLPGAVWTVAQLRAFLATARQHRLFAFFHVAAYTGARRGGLLNLRWTDIDLGAKKITVTGSTAVPVTAVLYIGAEALDPRGTDQVVTNTATALRLLPTASAHSSQLICRVRCRGRWLPEPAASPVRSVYICVSMGECSGCCGCVQCSRRVT